MPLINLNREEKRLYEKEARKHKNSIYCPKCGIKTMHIAVQKKSDPSLCNAACELCYHVALRDLPNQTPGEYVKGVNV